MRVIFLLMFLAGLAVGIGYPFVVSNVSGYEIGRYPAYDRQGGFKVVEENLAPADAPVRVLVDMSSLGSLTLDGATTEERIPLDATSGQIERGKTYYFRCEIHPDRMQGVLKIK